MANFEICILYCTCAVAQLAKGHDFMSPPLTSRLCSVSRLSRIRSLLTKLHLQCGEAWLQWDEMRVSTNIDHWELDIVGTFYGEDTCSDETHTPKDGAQINRFGPEL